MKWVIVALGVLANTGASVLAKTAGPITLAQPLANLANWRLMLSLALYGTAFLLYAASLQRLPLNIAHPVSTAGAIVLVGLVSAVFFQERFDGLRLAAYALLVLAIALLVVSGLREGRA